MNKVEDPAWPSSLPTLPSVEAMRDAAQEEE
jgi:hypothetical protein